MQEPNSMTPQTRKLLSHQVDYYNRFAPAYAPWVLRYMKPVIDPLVSLTNDAMDGVETVLELAPGPGTFTIPLSIAVKHVTALDASPVMLEILNALDLPNVETHQQDLFEWSPDGTRTWDAVFMSNWLAHVPPDELPAFFAKLSRVLNPGGQVCIVDVTPEEQFIEAEVSEDAGVPIVLRTTEGETYPVVKKYWEPHDLLAFLEPLGWTGTHVKLGTETGRGFVFYRLQEVS